ncbi:pyrophosphohydrolase domain-containing protein [Petrachloros mirabilis]
MMTKHSTTIDAQAMVEAFHKLFGIVVHRVPTLVDERTRDLRARLIEEEFEELKEAMQKNDLAGVAKEMADLLYVVYGTAVSYGIEMDPVFKEVHRSNMSKVGGHKREDGKWVKPATYSPAAIEPILARQALVTEQLEITVNGGTREVQPEA